MSKNKVLRTVSIDRGLDDRLRLLNAYWTDELEKRLDISARVNVHLTDIENDLWQETFSQACKKNKTKARSVDAFKRSLLRVD